MTTLWITLWRKGNKVWPAIYQRVEDDFYHFQGARKCGRFSIRLMENGQFDCRLL